MLNHRLLAPQVQAYLQAHFSDEPSQFALKKSPFEGVSGGELAHQLLGRQKSKETWPLWYGFQALLGAGLLGGHRSL